MVVLIVTGVGRPGRRSNHHLVVAFGMRPLEVLMNNFDTPRQEAARAATPACCNNNNINHQLVHHVVINSKYFNKFYTHVVI